MDYTILLIYVNYHWGIGGAREKTYCLGKQLHFGDKLKHPDIG